MIRYIDLGDQINEGKSQFSWWDTIYNEFIGFFSDYIWDTWEDFEESFWKETAFRTKDREDYLERFRGLFPKKED